MKTKRKNEDINIEDKDQRYIKTKKREQVDQENRKYREGYNIARKEWSENKYRGIRYRGDLEVTPERE